MEIRIRNENGIAIVEAGDETQELAPGRSITVEATRAKLGEVEGEVPAGAWDQDREQIRPT